MSESISRDAWLAALADAEAVPPEDDDPRVLTVRELADLFGVQRPAAARRAEMLVAAGKAERTTKLIRRHGDVRGRRAPAYRLLP